MTAWMIWWLWWIIMWRLIIKNVSSEEIFNRVMSVISDLLIEIIYTNYLFSVSTIRYFQHLDSKSIVCDILYAVVKHIYARRWQVAIFGSYLCLKFSSILIFSLQSKFLWSQAETLIKNDKLSWQCLSQIFHILFTMILFFDCFKINQHRILKNNYFTRSDYSQPGLLLSSRSTAVAPEK